MPRFISIFLCLALLTGCSSHKIQTQTVIYHGDMHKNRGAIIIRPVDSAWDDSLEFNAVKSAIAVRLKKHSYILTADEASASYKALVSYGIDEGRAKTVYQPIKQPYANTAVTLQKNAGNTSLATTEVIPHYYVSGHQPVNIIE